MCDHRYTFRKLAGLIFWFNFLGALSDIKAVSANSHFYKTFERLSQRHTDLSASAIHVQDKGGTVWEYTCSTGSIPEHENIELSIDHALRVNSISEILVCTVACRLHAEGHLNITGSLDPKYVPRRCNELSAISAQHLMQHTSGFIEHESFDQAAWIGKANQSESLHVNFYDFMTSYLFKSWWSKSLKNEIWNPDYRGMYHRARINTALLAYYLDQFIREKSKTYNFGITDPGLKGYVQHIVLDSMGMKETFFVAPSGEFAKEWAYTTRRVRDVAFDGTEISPVHPAIFAEGMLFSSVLDLSRLVRGLFVDDTSHIFTDGLRMRHPVETYSTHEAFSAIGQNAQGLGIVYYSPKELCKLAYEQDLIEQCPFLPETVIWGYTASSNMTSASFLCTYTDLQNTVCITTAVLFKPRLEHRSDALDFGMATSAFEQIFGELNIHEWKEINAEHTIIVPSIVLSVGCILIFTLLAAYGTERVISNVQLTG